MKFLLSVSILFVLFVCPAHSGEIVLSRSVSPINDVAEIILKEAYKRANIDLIIKKYPDKRGIHSANLGQIDGDVLRYKKIVKVFPNLIILPVVIYRGTINAFSIRKDIQINNWDDLKPYKLSHRIGVDLIEKNVKGMNVELVENEDQAFKLLSSQRIDLVIEINISGLKAIGRLKEKGLLKAKIIMIEPALFSANAYHVLHKKNQKIVPTLVKVLKEMEENGFMREVWNQFEANL